VKKGDRKQWTAARRPLARPELDEQDRHPDDSHEAIPETDPAHPIIACILGVVPASHWTFARVAPTGELNSLFGSHVDAADLARIADEFKLQRTKSPQGPRIAATLGSLAGYASGITLLFADARSNYGILTLLRTVGFGPFTSTEISVLTLALDSVSERLCDLRLRPRHQPIVPEQTGASELPDGAFYVLNADLQIVLAWSAKDQRRVALTGLDTRIAEHLPRLIEETVRQLTVAWSNKGDNQPGVAYPVPFLVVRTLPMSGPAGLFIGVRIERFDMPNSLTGAASAFHISPREVQVLALLLDGNRLDDIAKHLQITSSTVQDHIRSMIEKTASRNRSELIARVLGWESTPIARMARWSSPMRALRD
jgi:DNA-binding CsgD family transcriptional regulator